MTTTIRVEEIYRSRINILKNLDRIGFDTEPFKDADFKTVYEMCSNQHANLLNLVLTKKGNHDGNSGDKQDHMTDSSARTFVHYHIGTKSAVFKPTNLYDVIDYYKLQHQFTPNDTITVIIVHDTNDTMLKTLSQVWENDRVFVNIFSIQQLQFCIQDHTFVPPHIPMSAQEKADVYQKFFIQKDANVPEISRFDPVAKAIALRPGQLCQIKRPSKTAIVDDNFYRVCV